MKEVPNKTTGNSYTANEFTTGVKTELQSTVTATSQSFSEGNQTQLMQALTRIGGGAQVYTDSGAANAYGLSLSNPFSSMVLSDYFEGLMVNFVPLNTNTGASTVALGALAATPVLDEKGNPLVSGELRKDTLVTLIYRSSNFRLLRPFGEPRIAGKFSDGGVIEGIPTGFTAANVTVGAIISGTQVQWINVAFPIAFTNANYITRVAYYDSNNNAVVTGIIQGEFTDATKIRFGGIEVVNPPTDNRIPSHGLSFVICPNE